MSKTWDLLLMNAAQQQGWDVTSNISSMRPWLPSYWLTLLPSWFGGFEEVCCHIGNAHMARTWGWPLTNSQKELKPSVQWSARNWILSTTTRAGQWILPTWAPRGNPSLADTSMVACEEKQGKQLSCIWVPDHRNCVMISVCCSKKLNLGVITM